MFDARRHPPNQLLTNYTGEPVTGHNEWAAAVARVEVVERAARAPLDSVSIMLGWSKIRLGVSVST